MFFQCIRTLIAITCDIKKNSKNRKRDCVVTGGFASSHVVIIVRPSLTYQNCNYTWANQQI
jgi:hypothetical protein